METYKASTPSRGTQPRALTLHPPGSAPPGEVDEPRGGARQTAVRLLRALLADRRIRYIMVGSTGAAIYYGLFACTWLLFHHWLPYLLMPVIANLITAIATYPLYRNQVFQATGPWLSGFFKFYLTSFWALAFTLIGLPMLVEMVHLHVLISQALIIVVIPVMNYQINRLWAFRKHS